VSVVVMACGQSKVRARAEARCRERECALMCTASQPTRCVSWRGLLRRGP